MQKAFFLSSTLLLCLGAAPLLACSDDTKDKVYLDKAAMMDPATCKKCHENHYQEWSGSMHAYAADDPVFLAMNARGQRETNGELGDFCISCHAPLAVAAGLTTDGLNIAEVPQEMKGITCYFCHSINGVTGTHNAPMTLADDLVMRGGLEDPVENEAHASSYSTLHDRRQFESSNLCGPCHDIVTPHGINLERTFQEWKDSLFGNNVSGQHLSCAGCHMPGREGLAADAPGVYLRITHEHKFPGVDVALTDWPEKDAQLAAVQRDLDPAIQPQLCVAPYLGGVKLEVWLDNLSMGHKWPSGAAQDRRAWVELIAYKDNDVLYQSGVFKKGEIVSPENDPDLWLLRDRLFNDAGEEVHMFWEAKSYTSELLPPAVTNDKNDPAYYHAVKRDFPSLDEIPTRITLRVQIQPMGLEVLDSLIASGDLDPAIRDAMPTFELAGSVLEWTPDKGFNCIK